MAVTSKVYRCNGVLQSYAYQRSFPVLEQTTIVQTLYPVKSTDIAKKEMYSFDDRNWCGKLEAFRPEGDACCVRARTSTASV